jgi:hypothetical protein
MAAANGNDYNLIWTLEKTKELFDKILNYILDNKKCRSVSEAALEIGEYEDLVLYLEKKYPEQDFRTLKKAREIVKNRLVNQGLDGEANTAMAIFILKNNHGFRDKIETENINHNTNQVDIENIKEVNTRIDDLLNKMNGSK